jgi:hypothetical protein
MLSIQIKSGRTYRVDFKADDRQGTFGLNLGRYYLEKHRSRWPTYPGPVLLIYVENPENRDTKVYWQNLRATSSFSERNKIIVLIPTNNVFGSHMKGILKKLCGSVSDSAPLQKLDFTQKRSRLVRPNFTRQMARKFYTEWAHKSETKHPQVGKIDITSSGWRHLTRRSRRAENILNSLLLLEVAKEMRSLDIQVRQLGCAKKRELERAIYIVDHLALRAEVCFRYRESTIAQVIIRRVRTINKLNGDTFTRHCFLSVHELGRGGHNFYGH